MSTSKLLAQTSALALLASFLTACGGGGGGGGGSGANNPPPPPPPPPPPAAESQPIDVHTAKRYASAFILLEDLTFRGVYRTPYTISALIQEAQGQTIDDTRECTSGHRKATGTIDPANGTAEITLAYEDCVDSDPLGTTYSDLFTGSIHVTARGISDGYPTGLGYRYENYKWQDQLANDSLTYSGTTSVDPEDDALKFSASIALTDEAGVVISSSDYVSRVIVPEYASSPYYVRTTVSGHLKHSVLGTVTASASDPDNYVYLTGTGPGRLRIDANYDPLQLALDADGDGVYERFAEMPWDMIDRETADNTAPVVNLDSSHFELVVGQDNYLPLSGVQDAEFDLLAYSVQVLQKPSGATVQATVVDGHSLLLNVDASGEYTFSLTVDDGRGGSTTGQVTLHASRAMPNVEAPTANINVADGAIASVNLQPINPEAGPFTYQIVSGPAGLSVDSQGNLQWASSLPFFGVGETRAVVKVANSDHSVDVPVQFSATDHTRAEPIVRTVLNGPTKDKNIFVLDFNHDGSSRILTTDNMGLIYTLKFDGSTYVQDWVFPYALSGNGPIERIVPFDADRDGLFEIAVLTGSTVRIIDEKHATESRSRDLSSFAGMGIGFGHALAVADIDNDGSDELMVLYSDWFTPSLVVLDATTLAEKWRISVDDMGTDFAVGNVDGDAALELVLNGGYVYDGVSHANQWVNGSMFGLPVMTGDIDGDGIDEIVGTETSGAGHAVQAYSAVSKSQLWSIAAGGSSFCGAELAQLDGDTAKEILLGKCNGGGMEVYDATASSTTLKWSASYPNTSSSFAVGDTDGDGDDDVVLNGRPFFSTGSIEVFDPVTQLPLYTPGSGFLLGNFSGGMTAVQNGVQQVMFSSQARSISTSGSLFLALDPQTGTIAKAPLVDDHTIYPLSFCMFDDNGDSNDDILFSGPPYVSSYDFFAQLQPWKRNLSGAFSYAPPRVACGDFNGDGHTDVAVQSGNVFEMNDPFNQTLLSSSLPDVVQVASGDLNGDGKHELVALGMTILRKYGYDGANLVEQGSFTDLPSAYSTQTLSIIDVDGDLKPEIVLTAAAYDNNANRDRTTLLVLNADLTERSRTRIDGVVYSVAPETAKPGHLLVILANSLTYPTAGRAALIDVASGNWIWQSPMLNGVPSIDSLHYNAAAPNGGSISIATDKAMYITR